MSDLREKLSDFIFESVSTGKAEPYDYTVEHMKRQIMEEKYAIENNNYILLRKRYTHIQKNNAL